MGRGLSAWSVDLASERLPVGDEVNLPSLFHRLNNQLGIILANAELLEVQLADPAQRARAAQIVASALDAMTTARDVRAAVNAARTPTDPSAV